jgi:hypothetical protein
MTQRVDPSPIVILTAKGSIELTASAGDCVVEGCRKKGGNMVRFVVHHVDHERPQGFKICGDHFGQAVALMMEKHELGAL